MLWNETIPFPVTALTVLPTEEILVQGAAFTKGELAASPTTCKAN